MDDSLRNQAEDAILRRIIEKAPQAQASHLRDMAEALAWVVSPAQPHGGSTQVKS